VNSRLPWTYLRPFVIVILAIVLAGGMWGSLQVHSAYAATRVDSTVLLQRSVLSSSCSGNGIHYLNGYWPAHFRLDGCLIDTIQQDSWSVDIIALVINDTCDSLPCSISVDLAAKFIHLEIDHMEGESQQCGGQGVYMNVYGIVFRTDAVCPGTTGIPLLQESYNNTSIRRQDGRVFDELISIDGQDNDGTLSARWLTDGVTYYCSGVVDTAGNVSLSCTAGNSFDFSGSIYPDGHIEGVSVGLQTGNIYDEYMI
jgi:hypothetical protein